MTLKEKVMMMQPECVDNCHEGGVYGCPCDYSYLNEPELNRFSNIFSCSNCNVGVRLLHKKVKCSYKYCPYCGAKMEE